MDNGYSLSDIAALNGSGTGGNSWIVLIILFAMIFGFGGNGLGGNASRVGEAYATQADVQRAVDFDTLKTSINGVNDTVRSNATDTIGAIKDTAYNTLGEVRDIQSAVASGFANQSTCCCEIKQDILENRYLAAQNTSAIQMAIAQSDANTTAKIQSVLDKMAEDKIQTLQNQVNNLQMAQMFCGVPKINPYGYGVYPYNSQGCSCSSLATV